MPWRSAPVVVWAGLLFCWAMPAWAGDAASEERTWIERAEALVTAAKGHAEVAAFQRDVQAHRERLHSSHADNHLRCPPDQRR